MLLMTAGNGAPNPSRLMGWFSFDLAPGLAGPAHALGALKIVRTHITKATAPRAMRLFKLPLL